MIHSTKVAMIIRSNFTSEQVTPANGTNFSLEELQAIVGGYIELVQLPQDMEMYCNEEGKLKGLPYNSVATALTRKVLAASDEIVGDVIVGSYKLFREPEELAENEPEEL